MALREILAHFGFTIDRAGLDAAGRGVERVKHATEGAGASLNHFVEGLRGAVAGVAAGAFAELTTQIAEQAAALQDTSEQTGLATDELQAWTLQAQLGGASAQDFVIGLRKVSKELATGVDESGQQSKLFQHLGIATKDAHGEVRDLAAVLPEIAEKFKGLKSGAEKSALAQQLFGRSGTKLVPILNEGAEGIAKLHAQFEELGGGFSAEAIKRADEYDDSLVKLNFSFFGLKSLLATQVFPWLAKVVGGLTEASVGAGKWLKETTGVSTAIKILAAVLGGTLIKALAPFLLPGLKFLAIFLAVDDLIGFLQGKDSVIGKILNHMFGDGTATVVRKYCNDAKDAITGTLIGALDLLKLAFSENDEASKALWQDFELATRPVERILDSIFEKLNLIKSAFTDWDTIKTGANDFLDAITSPFDTDADKQQKQQRKTRRLSDQADAAIAANPIAKAVSNPAHEALANAYANIAGGIAAPASIRAVDTRAAATVNNISPINVQQTFAPGTGPEVRKLAKDAAREGVAQGLAQYRAALQNLDQKAPAP